MSFAKAFNVLVTHHMLRKCGTHGRMLPEVEHILSGSVYQNFKLFNILAILGLHVAIWQRINPYVVEQHRLHHCILSRVLAISNHLRSHGDTKRNRVGNIRLAAVFYNEIWRVHSDILSSS